MPHMRYGKHQENLIQNKSLAIKEHLRTVWHSTSFNGRRDASLEQVQRILLEAIVYFRKPP